MQQHHHILDLTRRHNSYLEDRVDLVASNSWISNWVRLTMSSLLSNSYCIGLPGSRIYGGCDYIDMIEREVVELATSLFGSKHGVVQFLSGMQANIGAYNAILSPGDTVVSAPGKYGGHYSHNKDGPLRFFNPRILPVPFDASRYNVDLDKLDELLQAEHPRLLVVGWSEFLFPHPLIEIRDICDRHGTRLMYDMSHVAGLLAGGEFQPEAGSLADIITSSTGKSLHAPDHGLCLFNDESLGKGVLDAVMPLLTSNTHPHELAALGIALSEMKAFGSEYARQVVRNSKSLGHALAAKGVDVLYGDLDYSQSHTLLVSYPHTDFAVTLLDRAGISVNASPLPWDQGDEASGLRLGTQVVTRRGMREAEMEQIADAVARVLLHGDDPLVVRHDLVTPLARSYQGVAYCFDANFPLENNWQQAPYRKANLEAAEASGHAAIKALALKIPAFHDLQGAAVETIADQMNLVLLEPGSTLLRRGEQADSVYFVAAGTLQVLDQDDRSVIAEIGEGGHVGEAGVLRNRPRSNNVIVSASGSATLLRLGAMPFRTMISEFAGLATYFEQHLRRIGAPSTGTDVADD